MRGDLERLLRERTLLMVAAGVALGYALAQFVGNLVFTIVTEIDQPGRWTGVLSTGLTPAVVVLTLVIVRQAQAG